MVDDPTQSAPQVPFALPGSIAGHVWPDHWPSMAELINWCQQMHPATAAILVLLGVIYLLFGYYMFKALVLTNAALLGVAVGGLLGGKQGAAVPAAIVGGVIAAAITWPLMRFAIAIMGGLFGAMVGASLWNTFNAHPEFAWAGAAMGLIACFLTCFILFRGCVMTFTSLQGAMMFIVGVLGLLLKYQNISTNVADKLQASHLAMPVIIFVATIAGVIFQQHNTTGGALPAPAKK